MAPGLFVAGPGAVLLYLRLPEALPVTANAKESAFAEGGTAVATRFPAQQQNNRGLRAAAVLLLCVALTAALLFGQLVGYAEKDTRQYIPLTRSGGITTVHTVQDDASLSLKPVGVVPNRPMLLVASPFLTAGWFRVADDNTVWNGNTQVEIFRVAYENGENQITVRSNEGDKVIAPGTENSYSFALENTADGPVEYSMTMKAYFSHEDYPIPVEVKVSRDTDKQYLLGSQTQFQDVLALNGVSDQGTLSRGNVMPYTISWQWPFEGDDAYDTLLGTLAVEEDLTLTIVIETTASYAPGAEGGVPQTGDTSNILLYFVLMIGSGAMLILLLLFGRRKREESTQG